MGRYTECVILTTLVIRRKKPQWFSEYDEEFDFKKQLDNIKRNLDGIIDTSKYDVKVNKNGIVFNLKLNFINDIIYDLLKELDPFLTVRCFIEELYGREIASNIDFNSPDLNKKYPLICNKDDCYKFQIDESEVSENDYFCDLEWLINDEYLSDNISISAGMIIIWSDFWKYIGESEYNLMRIINIMKGSYFKSKLSKSLLFAVIG